jgi:proteasome lid subunit RPN8/RPN11
MQKIILILFLLSSSLICSQNKETEKILNEGKLLFRLEKGSWYGTDDMLARFKTKKDSVGGYLSYQTIENKINTIFFSRFDPDKILIRYKFDSLPEPEPIKIDTLNRKATDLEKNLISIRQDARDKAYSNEDKFFSFYENTSLNFIPVINNKERNVFILTGPQVSGIVLIGNDYKLTYNKKNEFMKKEKIHNSILQFPYTSEDKENPTVSTFHSHVITEYISSTDICTLLLYKNYVEWKQHIVMSKKEVSIFNLEKESLFTMKRKAWEKIYNNQKDKK